MHFFSDSVQASELYIKMDSIVATINKESDLQTPPKVRLPDPPEVVSSCTSSQALAFQTQKWNKELSFLMIDLAF